MVGEHNAREINTAKAEQPIKKRKRWLYLTVAILFSLVLLWFIQPPNTQFPSISKLLRQVHAGQGFVPVQLGVGFEEVGAVISPKNWQLLASQSDCFDNMKIGNTEKLPDIHVLADTSKLANLGFGQRFVQGQLQGAKVSNIKITYSNVSSEYVSLMTLKSALKSNCNEYKTYLENGEKIEPEVISQIPIIVGTLIKAQRDLEVTFELSADAGVAIDHKKLLNEEAKKIRQGKEQSNVDIQSDDKAVMRINGGMPVAVLIKPAIHPSLVTEVLMGGTETKDIIVNGLEMLEVKDSGPAWLNDEDYQGFSDYIGYIQSLSEHN